MVSVVILNALITTKLGRYVFRILSFYTRTQILLAQELECNISIDSLTDSERAHSLVP